MRLLILISLFSFCAKSQTQININDSGEPVSINSIGAAAEINAWRTSSVIDDDGYYNGFMMCANATDHNGVCIYKKSSSHAAAGPFMLSITNNRATTWVNKPIRVDGTEIVSSNHSFIKHSSGRLIISYRVSGIIYFAYNDNIDTIFTSSATTVTAGANNSIYQSPIKMLEMPSGNILFFYYQYGTGGNPTIGSIMESSDIGQTFSFKSNIFSHNSVVSTPTLGDWRGHEIGVAITHNTGTDATCKMIALVRTDIPNEGGTYAMFFYSSDGGTTWTKNTVNSDPGSFVNDLGATISNFSPGISRQLFYPFLGSNSPVDIVPYKDSIYVVNGERNYAYGYSLKWTTSIPDSAYVNRFSVWHRPVYFKKFYNAYTLGSSTDCGYPVFFNAEGKLYVAQYDVSRMAADPLKSTRRCFVEIQKIK